MILDQRSDVEQFFLESLEQIKEEVRKKKVENKDETLPDIRGSSFNKSGSSLFNESMRNKNIKINLKDLDWMDRESVLRLLFSKMNSGLP